MHPLVQEKTKTVSSLGTLLEEHLAHQKRGILDHRVVQLPLLRGQWSLPNLDVRG